MCIRDRSSTEFQHGLADAACIHAHEGAAGVGLEFADEGGAVHGGHPLQGVHVTSLSLHHLLKLPPRIATVQHGGEIGAG